MTPNILMLPGDGVGPEVVAEAVKVLECLRQEHGLDATLEYGLLGGCAVDTLGVPYPEETRRRARAADAILLGAVGGPKWEKLDQPLRPESGLLALRADLGLCFNPRPVVLHPQVAAVSGLLPSVYLDANGRGLYQPGHGAITDLAGRGVANPLPTILAVAMLLRHSLNAPGQAERIERAIAWVLDKGLRTMDIMAPGMVPVGTQAMGDAVAAALAE
ncbi:MAG: isocitrate/isopropylmalate family dehydrogenase [Candidatus Contendobacter sp.]|nr:isocitrate/isopropylmalate family dehydrogenase [Candidatus Contendobacter sp.]MDG4556194.1 isocitrate/isopropylmalate family dehydrogenase [Candidatus Contendobacter sp.]